MGEGKPNRNDATITSNNSRILTVKMLETQEKKRNLKIK